MVPPTFARRVPAQDPAGEAEKRAHKGGEKARAETTEERRLRVDAAIATVVEEHRDFLIALAKR
jgi:hypothetical protein